MKLKINRGTGQIAYNLVEIATEMTKLILDCGRTLPLMDVPGVAIELGGLTFGKSAYSAVFVAHHHADHSGFIERVNADIPIYMSNETKIALGVAADFTGVPPPRADKILENGRKERVGDITVLPLCAGKGEMMLLIQADGQKILYTGCASYIYEPYCSLIEKIDVLLCDGIDIGSQSCLTEKEIEAEVARIMRETDGHIFALCSATDAKRALSIERACRVSGRTIALDPFMKAMQDRVGTSLFVLPVGFLPREINAPRALKYILSDAHSFDGEEADQGYTGVEAVSKMTNLTFMIRPTIGNFLRRLNDLTPLNNSTLIYAMWSGYEQEESVREFLELCRSFDMRIEHLRPGGHICRRLIETAALRLNPAALVPIHVESADLFSEFHENVVVLGDGEALDCGGL